MTEIGSAAILLATRNRAGLLERTLESLAALRPVEDVSVELIVVDDGSTDETPQVLRQYANNPLLPFSTRILTHQGQGKSFALNAALEGLKADVVAFTDDDMHHDSGWLKAIIEHFRSCSCVGVHGRIEVEFLGGRPAWISPEIECLFGSTLRLQGCAGIVPELSGGNMAARMTAIRKAGPFHAGLGPRGGRIGYSEDVEWSRRLARYGQLCFCPEALNFHLIPADRLAAASLRRRQFDFVRTEWRLKTFSSPRWELWSELRSLLGALLKPRRVFPWVDYQLEIAARCGRIAGLWEHLRASRA